MSGPVSRVAASVYLQVRQVQSASRCRRMVTCYQLAGVDKTTMEPFIKIDQINQIFAWDTASPVHALEDFSLDIGEKEFVTVVGRSGCGKSTLLRIIAGLLSATSGTVHVGGNRVERAIPDVSLVFQRASLLPWRSIIENVMLPVEILRLDRDEYRLKALELLDLVGLAGFEDRSPRELSGGMEQRAALCRSLLYDPDVLLMDEPFGALDALTREEMSLELQRIWTQHRKTIVFVTHSVSEAVLLADRIVVMTPRPGRLARIIDIDLPRPRRFGAGELSQKVDGYAEEVRQLLFAPDASAAGQAEPGGAT